MTISRDRIYREYKARKLGLTLNYTVADLRRDLARKHRMTLRELQEIIDENKKTNRTNDP